MFTCVSRAPYPLILYDFDFWCLFQVRGGIDGYSDGFKRPTDISDPRYARVYEQHLQELERWAAVESENTMELRMRWYRKLRCASGWLGCVSRLIRPIATARERA